MTKFVIQTAKRTNAKLRINISGPSGSGKTYSALKLAKGMTTLDKVLLIDTEKGSGSLYADIGDVAYNIIELEPPFSPEKFIDAIKAGEEAGMEVIIIDSATHEWDGEGGCLEIVDKVTQASRSKNSYMAWGKVTPRHKAFLNKIVTSKVHIIATSRKKTEYVLVNKGGRNVPEKVGMKDVQRDGYEYEFTVGFDLDVDHNVHVSKDRTGLFMGKNFKIDEEVGETILDWLGGAARIEDEQLEGLISITGTDLGKLLEHFQVKSISELGAQSRINAKSMLNKKLQSMSAETATTE